MKLEQLIVQYLYNSKKVSIENIGTFTITPNVSIPIDLDKDSALPEGAIQFDYNNKQDKDKGLIEFIVQQSHKILPLATSDLESYSLLANQFLNLGKPLVIEGIGTLQKNQEGELEFFQGHTVNPKLVNDTITITEKIQDGISFSTPAKSPTSRRGLIAIMILFFILCVSGALYYFLVVNSSNDEVVEQIEIPATTQDSTVVNKDTLSNAISDSLSSLSKTADSISNNEMDGFSFKIVLKEYPSRALAEKAFNTLTSYGHKLLILQLDSSRYALTMPFKSPLSDTLRVKDSLRIFFGGKPYVKP